MRSDHNDDTRSAVHPPRHRAAGRTPLRPATARLVLDASEDEHDRPADAGIAASKGAGELSYDPGWVLARARTGGELPPLELVAGRSWWPDPPGTAGEALERLWRHAVAVSQAVGRLAREAGDPEPERAGARGPPAWPGTVGAGRRRPATARGLARRGRSAEEARPRTGMAGDRGEHARSRAGRAPGLRPARRRRRLAARRPRERPGACASDPDRLALVQRAYALAEQTPWALRRPEPRDPGTMEPGLRVLVAEVQVRCGPGFVAPDATTHEERLARSNARLRIRLARLEREQAAGGSLADRTGRVGRGRRARRLGRAGGEGLVWRARDRRRARRLERRGGPGGRGAGERVERPARQAPSERPAWRIVPLSDRGRPDVAVHLWKELEAPNPSRPRESSDPRGLAGLGGPRGRPCPDAGEARRRSCARHRDRLRHEETRLAKLKLDALAEFAAGAGHELNNPLAVIVGRAQLLLAP